MHRAEAACMVWLGGRVHDAIGWGARVHDATDWGAGVHNALQSSGMQLEGMSAGAFAL